MARYRGFLPQLDHPYFLTDGGIETSLIYDDGCSLPHFAAYTLLESAVGEGRLRAYYRRYARLAQEHAAGFVFESPTWRANADWAEKLGHSPRRLAELNSRAIGLMSELRSEFDDGGRALVISACVGPRGDGYRPEALMSEAEAERYHSAQIETFAETDADMVSAITMTHSAEAVGVARAALACQLPVAISFTLETNGSLPSGESLADAIARVDDRTAGGVAYYMINCAHPSHFVRLFAARAAFAERIGGLRCNASRKSHAELDQATELDAGNPSELGRDYAELGAFLPRLSVLGGCCGTNQRHIGAIARAVANSRSARRAERRSA